MTEYIERETYRERLADLEGWCQDLRKPGLKQALEMFDEIPAADVAPVVHGRWEPCFDENCRCRWGFGKCSNCGQEYYAHAINHYKYCPNCGAKMDGGGERDG